MNHEIIKYIGKAEFNDEYGFIFNSERGQQIPFAFAYPNKTVDRKELLQFITDAINEKCNKTNLTERLVDCVGKSIDDGLLSNENLRPIQKPLRERIERIFECRRVVTESEKARIIFEILAEIEKP